MERTPDPRIAATTILFGFLIGVGLFIVFKTVLAWTNPTQAPPGGSGSGIIPSGAVMPFYLSNCPTGWTEDIDARGRYIVGLPAGGTLHDGAGIALSNRENRAVGQHNHGITGSPSISDPGHYHTVSANSTVNFNTDPGNAIHRNTINTGSGGTGGQTTGITVGVGSLGTANAGSVGGTNAPYIQYLICKKN